MNELKNGCYDDTKELYDDCKELSEDLCKHRFHARFKRCKFFADSPADRGRCIWNRYWSKCTNPAAIADKNLMLALEEL